MSLDLCPFHYWAKRYYLKARRKNAKLAINVTQYLQDIQHTNLVQNNTGGIAFVNFIKEDECSYRIH